MSEHLYLRNLLALAPLHPDLGARLGKVEPDPRLKVQLARSGAPVPLFSVEGRTAALHSLVDPEREAERLVQAQPEGNFIVALGLGAGYGIKARLASPATSGILVIEYSAPLLRAILEQFDLAELFLDRRLLLLLDPSPEELEASLLSSYVPPLAGDIRTQPLRGRTDLDPEPFARAAETVRRVLDRISDDYSVQAFFGKLWFRNTVRNLFIAERPSTPLPPIRRAAISAAGPSLEAGLPELSKAKAEGAFLIATDTSLPALLGAGLRPDAVVSIDCQVISYYHFLKGIPPELPLILDLASPNRLARLTDSVRFFSSGHPFCAYVSSRFRPFPALDTSGGNVTHAAISLAEALGAESAFLFGADFSYPDGKSYARGTYIYDYYGRQAGRLTPVESLFSGFIFRNAAVSRERDRDAAGRPFFRYVTKPLMAYREHLERFAARSGLRVIPFRGRGVEIRIPERAPAPNRERGIFAAGRAAERASAFLARYAEELSALPTPNAPVPAYLRALEPSARDLWTTLLPTASAFQRGQGTAGLDSAELLAATRAWALREIEEALALAP